MSQSTKDQPLTEWFRKLEKPLIIYAYQIVHDREEAEDLVQEVFLRFSRQENEILEPRAWLYKTLRNLSISFLRKNNRLQRTTDEDQMDFLHTINQFVENQKQGIRFNTSHSQVIVTEFTIIKMEASQFAL